MDAPPLCPSQDIVNRNDKSEPIPHLEDSVRIIMDWSEWRDLNPRPHGPEFRESCHSPPLWFTASPFKTPVLARVSGPFYLQRP